MSHSRTMGIWSEPDASEGYVYIQLRDFKSGTRNAPEDAAMRAVVAAMSDADMRAIAKYASSKPWPKVAAVSTDSTLLKKEPTQLLAARRRMRDVAIFTLTHERRMR